jgi:hypothetical protein
MKCDDVWPVLETGNFWERWRARRHLDQCPTCAQAAHRLVQVKRLLAEPEPLSPELRMRWRTAMAGDAPATLPVARKRSRIVLAAAAAAAAIVVAVVLWPKPARQPNRPARDVVGMPRFEPNPIEPKREAKRDVGSSPALATVIVETSPIQVKEIDVADELVRLRHELARSETEIRKLSDQAKLRQASAQLDLLLAKYTRN